jgi:hypothetical protein
MRCPEPHPGGARASRRVAGFAFAAACALFASGAPAAEDAALLRDLTSVIQLLGMPCGRVVSAKRQGDNDHVASCSNGSRYRVFVNAQGRAVAQKQ